MPANSVNVGEREPLSDAFDPTEADDLSQDNEDRFDYRAEDRVSTINGYVEGNERPASKGSNIPKPRKGEHSPRAQIWAFNSAKNPKSFHRAAAAAASNNDAVSPYDKVGQWIPKPNQSYETIEEMTLLSQSPPRPRLTEKQAAPLPQATKENIKRIISQQVAEKRCAGKELQEVLARERASQREAERANQGLERKVGRLERDLEQYKARYKELEERTKREINEKDAEIANLTNELEERRADQEGQADGKAASSGPKKSVAAAAVAAGAGTSAKAKKPAPKKPSAPAAAAKKPAAASKNPAAPKKPAAAAAEKKKAGDKKSAAKKAAEKKNEGKREVVGKRTSARIAALPKKK